MRAAPMFTGGGIFTPMVAGQKDYSATLNFDGSIVTGPVSVGVVGGAGVAASYSGGQKIYFEGSAQGIGRSPDIPFCIGVMWSGWTWATSGTVNHVGDAVLSVGYNSLGGVDSQGSPVGAGWSGASAGDIVMCAVDTTGSGKIWFGLNGVWMKSGDPASGANPATTLPNSSIRPALSSQGASVHSTLYSQDTLHFTPPAGFVSI
jgi:hypothetical protein